MDRVKVEEEVPKSSTTPRSSGAPKRSGVVILPKVRWWRREEKRREEKRRVGGKAMRRWRSTHGCGAIGMRSVE
jgi:hypothetical protein